MPVGTPSKNSAPAHHACPVPIPAIPWIGIVSSRVRIESTNQVCQKPRCRPTMLMSAAYCTAVAKRQKIVLPTRFAQRARLLSTSSSASARAAIGASRGMRPASRVDERPRPRDDQREQRTEPGDECGARHQDDGDRLGGGREERRHHRDQREADDVEDACDDRAPRAPGDPDPEPGAGDRDEGDVSGRPGEQEPGAPRRRRRSEEFARRAVAARKQRSEPPGAPDQEAGRTERGHQHGRDREVYAFPCHRLAEQPPGEQQHRDGDDAGDPRAKQQTATRGPGDRHE